MSDSDRRIGVDLCSISRENARNARTHLQAAKAAKMWEEGQALLEGGAQLREQQAINSALALSWLAESARAKREVTELLEYLWDRYPISSDARSGEVRRALARLRLP
jgi:hypothetical protein